MTVRNSWRTNILVAFAMILFTAVPLTTVVVQAEAATKTDYSVLVRKDNKIQEISRAELEEIVLLRKRYWSETGEKIFLLMHPDAVASVAQQIGMTEAALEAHYRQEALQRNARHLIWAESHQKIVYTLRRAPGTLILVPDAMAQVRGARALALK